MYKKMISEKSGLPKANDPGFYIDVPNKVNDPGFYIKSDSTINDPGFYKDTYLKQYGGGSIFFPQNLSQANYRKGDAYRPAQSWYLPEDLGNRGNVLGALATAGEAFTDLFSGKDIDGDGFKDGALRDFGKKRKVHKDNKHSYYSYKVETDINDPNVDPKTGKTKYIFDTKDLYEGRLDNEEDYAQRIFDNSQVNYDPETQSYKGILTAHSTDADVYGKEDREFLNDPTNKTLSELYADIKANPEQAKGLYEWNVDIKDAGAPAGTQFGVTTSGGQGSYLRDEQGQQSSVNIQDIDRGMMFRQTGGESTMGMMIEPSLDPMMMENEDLQKNLSKAGPEFLQAFMQVVDQSQRQREYAEHYGLYKESPYARRKVQYAQGGIETDEYDRNKDGVIDDQDTIELDEVTVQTQGSNNLFKPAALPAVPIPLQNTQPNLQLPAPAPPLATSAFGAAPPGGGNPGGPPAPPSYDDPVITRGNKFKGTLNYLMDSPGMDAFAKIGNAAVAGAGVINQMALNRRAEDAEQNLRFNLTQADNIYGTYEEREGDRGMWDVNTGIAQPDNLDVGYAQFGMEMPPMEMPKQEAEVVDVDFETLTNLISAGADIEIL
jgi:hypothetical protein